MEASNGMRRVTRKLVSVLGVMAVVFAQLAVSAHACAVPSQRADASVQVSDTVEPSADCCEPGTDCGAAVMDSLCQFHCDNAPQHVNDNSPALALAALTSHPAFVNPLPMAATAELMPPSLPFLRRSTSPPHTIRDCCLRI